MKNFLFLILTFVLTSCVANYQSPSSGPTASITNNSNSLAAFNYFQNAYQCTNESALTNNFLGKGSDTTIPANRMVTLSGYANNDLFKCKDYLFSFTPKANHRYAMKMEITQTPIVQCSLSIYDLTENKNQSYVKRQFTRNFWSGNGMCTDNLTKQN